MLDDLQHPCLLLQPVDLVDDGDHRRLNLACKVDGFLVFFGKRRQRVDHIQRHIRGLGCLPDRIHHAAVQQRIGLVDAGRV